MNHSLFLGGMGRRDHRSNALFHADVSGERRGRVGTGLERQRRFFRFIEVHSVTTAGEHQEDRDSRCSSRHDTSP
jgi:hypothetical protein